jgi:hypothetical protein
MFATAFATIVTTFLAVGVIEEVVVPAGTYAYETGTELYQEHIVGTD